MTGDAVADRIEENRHRSRQEVGRDRQLVARTGKITNRKLSSQAKKWRQETVSAQEKTYREKGSLDRHTIQCTGNSPPGRMLENKRSHRRHRANRVRNIVGRPSLGYSVGAGAAQGTSVVGAGSGVGEPTAGHCGFCELPARHHTSTTCLPNHWTRARSLSGVTIMGACNPLGPDCAAAADRQV